MTLKRRDFVSDAGAGGGPVPGSAGAGGGPGAGAMFDDVAPPTSARFESEDDTIGKKEPKKKQKAADRFPGVFGAPAPGAEPGSSFDDSVLGPLASITKSNEKRQAEPGKWEMYTVAELVRFRDEITRQLPSTELSSLNLEQEVLLQYHTLRELQANVLADEDIPANQRAQVANAVASILRTLAEKQESLYSSERFKDVENLLVRALSLWPEKEASKFISEYEEILKNHVRS